MRFMMLMYPQISEDDWQPDPEMVAKMGKYNEELQKAGVLLALDGLQASSKGARVTFSGGKQTVTDGPFTEAKELVGGYWLIQVRSKEEAVEWASRCPQDDCMIEVRQVFELTDFPPEVQAAAGQLLSKAATHRAIDAVWRIEAAKVIAGLTRIVRDVGLAEDLAQDALLAALEQWPQSGVPDNPGAWLMGTAKHRAIDVLRRGAVLERKREQIALELSREPQGEDLDAQLDDQIGDDLLRLIFMTCHPVLAADARVALTLRLFGGLTTEEIARAYLVRESTVAQRIVRAKRTLAEANVPFDLPAPGELSDRLASVLEVIYLVFNEGYAATGGEQWMRLPPDRGGAPPRADPRRPARGRTRGARARRSDGDPGLTHGSANESFRRAGAAARPGPPALGSGADPPRAGGARPRPGVG